MNNNNLELKLVHCKEKLGWTCDTKGNVYNKVGKIIGSVDELGYKRASIVVDGKAMNIKLHQYIWYYFKMVSLVKVEHKDLG